MTGGSARHVSRRGGLVAAALLASVTAPAAEPAWRDVAMSKETIGAKLRHAARNRHPDIGLPHLLMTFDTRSCGVRISADLRETRPTEMTIVLQYQFERLVVASDHFAVDLWFSGKRRRLAVPFTALSAFWDMPARERATFVPGPPCGPQA